MHWFQDSEKGKRLGIENSFVYLQCTDPIRTTGSPISFVHLQRPCSSHKGTVRQPASQPRRGNGAYHSLSLDRPFIPSFLPFINLHRLPLIPVRPRSIPTHIRGSAWVSSHIGDPISLRNEWGYLFLLIEVLLL